MANSTLQELLKVGPVRDRMLPDSYFTETAGMAAPDLLVGVELEIEAWPHRGSNMSQFHYESDGSLRNNGVEAKSVPFASKYLPRLLTEFFSNHRINDSNYSERCSTHVHMNVQDFTLDNLRTLCLTYQVVERLMFNFIGNHREESIFCVPWHASGVTYNFTENLSKLTKALTRNWLKYTALNLNPVQSFGTVEFRHMHGTCDVEYITKWVNLIGCLANWAKKMKSSDVEAIVLNMNTISNYGDFLQDVFGEHTDALKKEGYESALAVGVIDAKIMLITPAKGTPIYIAPAEEEEPFFEEEDDEDRREHYDEPDWPPSPAPVPIGPQILFPNLQARTVPGPTIMWDEVESMNTPVSPALAELIEQARQRNLP